MFLIPIHTWMGISITGMDSNCAEMEVKGETVFEHESMEPVINLDNNAAIENVSDPLDFLKIESLTKANNQEESPIKDSEVTEIQVACNICQEQFSSKETLRKHSPIHNNTNHIFMCSQCSECFVTRTSLNTHKLTHSATNTLTCDICDKPFTSVTLMRIHKRLHRLAACVLCHKRFADGKELDKHILDNHNSKEESYECDVCDKVVASLIRFNKHKRSHQLTGAKEVINEHNKVKEHVEKIYECDVCHAKVSSPSSLRSHKFLHITQECDKCHKRFADTKELYKHKTIEHEDENNGEVPLSITVQGTNRKCSKRNKRNVDSVNLFNCDVCGESFDNNVVLNTHKFTHIGGKITFACSMCEQKFDSSEKRNKHELVHDNKKITVENDTSNPFKCPICRTHFANKINLNYHTKTHHFLKNVVQIYAKSKDKNIKSFNARSAKSINLIQNKKSLLSHKNDMNRRISKRKSTKSYKCTICNKCFYHNKNLVLHTKSHVDVKRNHNRTQINRKSEEAKFECKLCLKKIETAEKFKIHSINHMQGYPYRCTICHKRFVHKRKLSLHFRARHEDSPTENNHQIVCNFCNEEFTSLSELTLHKQSQHALECDICHKRFTTKYVLRDHIRIHTGEMPYKCLECHRQFRTLMNLNGHMIVHKQEKRHECTICHEWFTRTSNLKYHLNKRHFFKDYECDVCHEQFTNEYNRDQHVKTQHSEDAVFECDHCLKRFKNKYALKEHERIHTGEKPYECKVCHMRFRTGPNLNSHVGSVHKQDRNHECGVCHKRFSRGSNLNRHMKTHIVGTAPDTEKE